MAAEMTLLGSQLCRVSLTPCLQHLQLWHIEDPKWPRGGHGLSLQALDTWVASAGSEMPMFRVGPRLQEVAYWRQMPTEKPFGTRSLISFGTTP